MVNVESQSPSVISCKDKIIKYSHENIIFFENEYVYKQFPFNKFKWVSEVINVNTLKHPNIICFYRCEIVDDYVIDVYNQEICLDKKEKVVRITMDKYDSTLLDIYDFTDREIFYIINCVIIAIMHCNNKHILHRDIKEANIFINHKKLDTGIRVITDVVLADFNISKYKYKIKEINTYKIITISHRPPEISYAILKKKHYDYDERVDVWSFCIVLTYLITGKVFYKFLSDGYLKIDPSIIYDVDKIIIALNHFISIYEYTHLKYMELYKKLIFMGIRQYEERATFKDLLNEINKEQYSKYLCNITHFNMKTPSQILFKRNIENQIVKNIHNISKNHDVVLLVYYKFYQYMKKKYESFLNIHHISLYILTAALILDENISINQYINIINHLELPSSTINIKEITKDLIENTIINIMKINEYTLL